MAVYRTAFALSGFFFLMSLFTVGLKTSRGFRAGFHNGAWVWKYLLLIGIGVGVFCIPSERIVHFQIGIVLSNKNCVNYWAKLNPFPVLIVWMYIALVGAVAFVLIQLWLLVFFARSMANKINQRIAEGGKPFCWYGGKRNLRQTINHFTIRLIISFFLWSASFTVMLLCYTITVVGTMALFTFFTTSDGCTSNKIFIGINAALCFLLSVISALMCCGKSMTTSSGS